MASKISKSIFERSIVSPRENGALKKVGLKRKITWKKQEQVVQR